MLAAGISARLSADTIYTLKLRRRGIDITRGRAANLLEILTVADAMQPVPAGLEPGTPLDEVSARLAAGDRDALPVVDPDGTYRGAVTAREAQEAARANTLDATAGQLARALPALNSRQTLHSALATLLAHEGSGLPVLSASRSAVVGWLNHRGRAARLQHAPAPNRRAATPAPAVPQPGRHEPTSPHRGREGSGERP